MTYRRVIVATVYLFERRMIIIISMSRRMYPPPFEPSGLFVYLTELFSLYRKKQSQPWFTYFQIAGKY